MRKCLNCASEIEAKVNVYCSNKCQADYFYSEYIKKWKSGKVDGNRGINAKGISNHIRRYLFKKYNTSCTLCGWSQKNEFSGKVPLEIDHIDGNSENNSEANLRLICPNCHSLTSSFRNLNKGNGRLWRKEKYVKNVS